MSTDSPLTTRKTLEPHSDKKMAVDMINSIRILGPDLKIDENRTRRERLIQFNKIKEIMEDYDFCSETGKVIRVK